VLVARPLLNTSRAEIEAYLSALAQPWREDDSNLDPHFLRNRVRHALLPLLQREYNPNLSRILSDTAEVARAEEEYWQSRVAAELSARTVDPSCLALGEFAGLALAFRRRILREFASAQGVTADFEHIENLLRCSSGDLGRTDLPGGWTAVSAENCLRLLPPPTLTPGAFPGYLQILPVPGGIEILAIRRAFNAVLVPPVSAEQAAPGTLLAADLLGAELTVRNWRPGDRFLPAHSRSEEKLKRLFSEEKIPQAQRDSWPVILRGEVIVWVRGFRVARMYQWRGQGNAVRIEESGLEAIAI
jgi:tRNA(Ile)-lysidine synthase